MPLAALARLRRPALAGALALAAGAPGIAVRAEPVFTPDATVTCVEEVTEVSPRLDEYAVLHCAGRAAQACMETSGGYSTVGMIECLGHELEFWDSRLNAAYAARIDDAKSADAELRSLGSAAPSLEDALRAMQRAWIGFRDAACLYEQAQWMGGTGGGPATMACHLHETARQALKLEGWWGQ